MYDDSLMQQIVESLPFIVMISKIASFIEVCVDEF